MDEEYDVDGGLDMYESRKKKGTKVHYIHSHRLTIFQQHAYSRLLWLTLVAMQTNVPS